MKACLSILLAVGLLAAAQASDVATGLPVTIRAGARHGHATPTRQGFTHTGGGNIDVQQPTADTLVITLTGVCVAGGHPCKHSVASFDFDVEQCFEIAFDDRKVEKARLTLEWRVLGLLRSHKYGGGIAEQGQGCASVWCGETEIAALRLEPHSVGCGENLSVNCRTDPVYAQVVAGKYTLRQTFHIAATHPRSLLPCKAAAAEFAPDPALDPLWISHWEPFHGAAKKDFGFQITIKVADDSDATEPRRP
jgi:hypothetical protein